MFGFVLYLINSMENTVPKHNMLFHFEFRLLVKWQPKNLYKCYWQTLHYVAPPQVQGVSVIATVSRRKPSLLVRWTAPIGHDISYVVQYSSTNPNTPNLSLIHI